MVWSGGFETPQTGGRHINLHKYISAPEWPLLRHMRESPRYRRHPHAGSPRRREYPYSLNRYRSIYWQIGSGWSCCGPWHMPRMMYLMTRLEPLTEKYSKKTHGFQAKETIRQDAVLRMLQELPPNRAAALMAALTDLTEIASLGEKYQLTKGTLNSLEGYVPTCVLRWVRYESRVFTFDTKVGNGPDSGSCSGMQYRGAQEPPGYSHRTRFRIDANLMARYIPYLTALMDSQPCLEEKRRRLGG